MSRGVSVVVGLGPAATDVERREGGSGRFVGGRVVGGVGVGPSDARDGGGEVEGTYRRARMAPMDVRDIGVTADVGRGCRMEDGGPSGIGPSHLCLLDMPPPGWPAGGWGFIRVVGDVCLGSGCDVDEGMPVLKRRLGAGNCF
jgi:hypothetical protein